MECQTEPTINISSAADELLAQHAEAPEELATSSNEERDLVESYRLGVNSYIQKPVDFDKFVDCVAQLGLYWLLVNQVPQA